MSRIAKRIGNIILSFSRYPFSRFALTAIIMEKIGDTREALAKAEASGRSVDTLQPKSDCASEITCANALAEQDLLLREVHEGRKRNAEQVIEEHRERAVFSGRCFGGDHWKPIELHGQHIPSERE